MTRRGTPGSEEPADPAESRFTQPDDSIEPGLDAPDGSAEPPPSRTRRLRLDLIVGAAVLLGVLVVGKGLSGGSHDTPSTRGSSSPRLVSRPPVSTSRVAPSTAATLPTAAALPTPGAADPTICPVARCSTLEAGSGLALEPVRNRFPNATVVRFHTVLLRTGPWDGTLWYRELRFDVGGGQEIDIRISATGRTALEQRGRLGTQMFEVLVIGPYAVRITAPQSVGLTATQLQAIAFDKRLFAP